MAKHNKKRNVGLLYEQLLRFACNNLVDGDNVTAHRAIDILCKNFKRGSSLYEEFRLFNAVVNTRVSSESLAKKIIFETKQACTRHNPSQLNKEKSVLIKEINLGLNDRNFYNQRLKNYKIFATVQALLNEWRKPGALAPEEIAGYEHALEDWLLRESVDPTDIDSSQANPLTLSLMMKKFDTKYSSKLSTKQKELFESFLYGNDGNVLQLVKEIKKSSVSKVEDYFSACNNQTLLSKKPLIEERIRSIEESAKPESVAKTLTIIKLIEEMESGDE